MKLTIQKTTEPISLISDAEIRDIKELLLGLNVQPAGNLETEDEAEFDEEEFPVEEETDLTEMTVFENDERYRIELLVPGFSKEDFVIEVTGDGILSINALSEVEFYEDDEAVSTEGAVEKTFNRVFRLPEDANCDEMEASYKNNILALTVAKS